jgi:hypothetical protein
VLITPGSYGLVSQPPVIFTGLVSLLGPTYSNPALYVFGLLADPYTVGYRRTPMLYIDAQTSTAFCEAHNNMFADSYAGPITGSFLVRNSEIMSAAHEPETYVMLLAGLGVMGFMLRRRKQSALAA